MWCKEWLLASFPCACSQMAPLLNISLSISNPHFLVLGPLTSSKFNRVLYSSLNNACVFNIKSFPEQFLTSFCAFYYQSYSFSWTFMDPIPDAIIATIDTCPKCILSLISQLDQNSDSFSSNSPSSSITEVCMLQKPLVQNLFYQARTDAVESLTFIALRFCGKIFYHRSARIEIFKKNRICQ